MVSNIQATSGKWCAMRSLVRLVQAAVIGALMLAPSVWLAYVTESAQFKRAAADRVAWCMAHPEQEAGTEMCYPQRSIHDERNDWCSHDWQEQSAAQCNKRDQP